MELGIMLYIGCKKADVFEQINILKEIGVRRTFINAKHPQLDRVLCALQEAGIVCDNLHSEYQGNLDGKSIGMDDFSREGPAGEYLLSRIMKNIDQCAQYHIPVIVVHPSNDEPEKAINDIARQRYTALGNYAREKGVEIAFENVKFTKNLEFIMSLIPDAKFCWDCGHEYSRLVGDRPMPLFGKRLAALHIHDNFLTRDQHLIPFTGKIDFEVIAKQLAWSGYDGTLMLEIMYRDTEGLTTEPTYKEFATKAKLAAEKVIRLVEHYRSIESASS